MTNVEEKAVSSPFCLDGKAVRKSSILIRKLPSPMVTAVVALGMCKVCKCTDPPL